MLKYIYLTYLIADLYISYERDNILFLHLLLVIMFIDIIIELIFTCQITYLLIYIFYLPFDMYVLRSPNVF